MTTVRIEDMRPVIAQIGADQKAVEGLVQEAKESVDALAVSMGQAVTKSRTATQQDVVQAVDPGPFGGLFLGAKAAQNLKLNFAEDATGGPKFGIGISATVAGGHPNGPENQKSALWLMTQKESWLTTTATGEIDGAYIVLRQGAKDDAGGILIDAAKVFGSGADTGGLTPMEISGAKIDPTGTTTHRVHVIPAFMEGLGGLTNSSGSGLYLEARAGAIQSGLHIVGRSDLAGAPAFSNILVAATSRDPASRYFQISGQGEIFFGSPTSQIRMRVTEGILHFRDTNATTNLVSIDQTGTVSAVAGFHSPGVAGENFRNALHAVNATGKRAGLLRYDGAEWVMATGSTATATWVKVSDPSVVAHQPV